MSEYSFAESGFLNGVSVSVLQAEISAEIPNFLGLKFENNLVTAVFSQVLTSTQESELNQIILNHDSNTILPEITGTNVNFYRSNKAVTAISKSFCSTDLIYFNPVLFNYRKCLVTVNTDSSLKIRIFDSNNQVILGDFTTSGGFEKFLIDSPISETIIEIQIAKNINKSLLLFIEIQFTD